MRSAASQQAKSRLDEHRSSLADRFRRDPDATSYLAGHTRLVDELIEARAEALLAEAVGLFAIAGYGRGRLFPASDIDLLLVRPRSGISDAELKRFFRELWDTGLRVSQQVCDLQDFQALALDDWEFILALQDLRPLWGSRTLMRRAYESRQACSQAVGSERLVARILESVRERHLGFNETIYHLEPDLKKGPGGLRDLHVLELVRRLTQQPSIEEQPELVEAQKSLSLMRIALHLTTGRDQNRLTHRLQERVARMLQPCSAPALAVEHLMEEYFRQARFVESGIRRLLRSGAGETGAGPAPSQARVFNSFHQFLEDLIARLRGAGEVEPDLLDAVHLQAGRLARGIIHPLLGEPILELFQPCPGLYSILRELHDSGLLTVLFPEFESIRSRVVRDFYHRYTVDEHSLRAIKVSEDLVSLPSSPDRRFSTLLEEVSQPAILTLSLLLHDVGKGQGGNHSEKGAVMAERALARFRYSHDLIGEVGFLIRNHLAMSSLIQKRDLDDERVVAEFADRVGNVERLRLLCILTFCDISAVSPEAMSNWRKDRLWQLYLATYHQLTREYGKHRVWSQEDHRELVTRLPSTLDAREFERFLTGFPRRYLVSTPWEEIYQHFRLAQAVSDEEPVQLRLGERGGHRQLSVVTRDQRRLFARIAGLVSYFEMSIGKGHGFSNQAGLVLDCIEFSDPRGTLDHPGEKEHFLEMLRAAISDELSVKELLRRKEQSVVFRSAAPAFEPVLTFHDPAEGNYTILELVAPDSMGLLYRIATQLARLDCNIELVLINTEGHRAIDVFYLTYQGKRLDDERKQSLEKAISSAVGATSG